MNYYTLLEEMRIELNRAKGQSTLLFDLLTELGKEVEGMKERLKKLERTYRE